MTLKIGELCAGYGGLGMAVEEVFGAELAWVSEFDEAPSKILAHHWPDVPNYGDMTKIDWAAIEPVDIISGGTPCQDLSGAGRRAGMTEGTRSNLWVQMREAIATIKPTYVVWENVRGAYSAEANSDLESCPGCMGDTPDRGAVLRALGRVLGDLSDLGYDCQWRGLRAADVGAPHGRFRVFILATKNTDVSARSERRIPAPGQAEAGRAWADTGRRGGTPVALAGSATLGQFSGRAPLAEAGAVDRDGPGNHRGERPAGDRRPAAANASCISGERRGINGIMAGPTGASEADGGQRERNGDAADGGLTIDPAGVNWGEYEPAIRRWESTLGRRAPAPTEPTGRNGGHRLSARFAEWMMGVPGGWIVDVPGISRNDALKAAGNGVVPQQAAAALRDMLSYGELAVAA